MSAREKIVKIGLPFIILIAVGFIMAQMIKSRKSPERIEKVDRGALVEFMVAEKSNRQVTIHSTGIVQPRQEITIAPQVNGNVTEVSDRFIAGGFFRKGESLFKVETIDYELALEQARANLAKREYELSSVESKARIARQEWERMNRDQSVPPNSLALYEPQLKDAKANLASAQAALQQAELNLARTTITAPFNCVVRTESIDKGQYVRAGNGVAVIAGTDTAEVVVPVELNDLQWLEVPAPGNRGESSPAEVRLNSAGITYSWPGVIDRLLAEVDSQGRMARMVVSINDPYLLRTPETGNSPVAAIGSFVNITFKGRVMADVFAIPRQALRDDSTVWIMGPENLLRIRPVTTVRLERDAVFVNGGLEPGERVVLTNLTGAANGMKLRAVEKGERP
ncbi:MAG: efflux RND transporter periplasmic adaptor subunit [Proteobacteria bacterium]|nr:efflux RND transporter periplasmic adaptor subunit [Pseudomonadota bacterium]MBU1737564.1 efflux RND transporter periplasmic adaptor subunit [Pseudomonadota bacterium]